MKRHVYVPILLVLLLLGAGTLVWAKQETPSFPPPAQQPQMQQAAPQVWSPQQLNNLVAPIALYPDPLLGQMLVASTYPLEVVEANQWLQRNRNLGGRELMDAAKQQPWDPSVQALVAVPDALAMLNQDIRWTTDLGNAFLAQQADVMNAVQQMRAQAQANGRLFILRPSRRLRLRHKGVNRPSSFSRPAPRLSMCPAYDPFYRLGTSGLRLLPPALLSGIRIWLWMGLQPRFLFRRLGRLGWLGMGSQLVRPLGVCQ